MSSHDTPATNDAAAAFRRAVRWGALLWLVFCVVAVLLRGVRWDESFEHAQVITGQVAYPEGHPLRVYVRGVFSLQTYASAAMLALGAGPALICGARNLLFLLGTVLPVFFLTALLTRRARWGHIAALLILQGTMLEFDGSYPTFVWPELYSNGHIGGAIALLTLIAYLAGCGPACRSMTEGPRAASHVGNTPCAPGTLAIAAFLFGVMPCIHAGQWPVLLGFAPLFCLFLIHGGETPRVLRAIPFFLAGIGVCVACYVILRGFAEAPPDSGPYAVQGDSAAVWKAYTARYDPHRRFPPGNGHVILAGMLLLSALAAWREQNTRQRRIFLGLLLYTMGVAGAVWGIMVIHAALGADIPLVLIVWMPYRLINHLPPLCLALMVGILCRPREDGRVLPIAGAAVAALLFGAVSPWFWPLLGQGLFARYFTQGDAVPFLLFGAAWLHLALPPKTRPARHHALLLVMPLVLLTPYHQFGTACLGAGYALALLCRWPLLQRTVHPRCGMGLAALGLVAAAALVAHQYRYRQELPTPDFSVRVAAYLAEQGQPRAMLATPPEDLLRQAHTGHPVLAEVATPSLISYKQEIGPAIAQLYADLYSIHFSLPVRETPSWESLWQTRSAQEWHQLAETYGFAYVIAPINLPLNLQPVLADTATALYAVTTTAPGG